MNQPPFDDPAIRQAFAHAIDKARLADLVLRGTAIAADTILPPGMPGYDPEQAGLGYDPELARTLLASSRYAADGAMPEIVLSISGTSGYLDGTSEAVIAMLKDNLGLDVTVEQVEWSDFLRDMNRQAYGFYSSGWIADYPDPQNFLDLLFYSTSSQNHTGYANPTVDAPAGAGPRGDRRGRPHGGLSAGRGYYPARCPLDSADPWGDVYTGQTVRPGL